jgi:Kelch motif
LNIQLAERTEELAMVTLNNEPVIFGGRGSMGEKMSSVYKLDLRAKAWVKLPDMEAPRDRHGVAAVTECWLCNSTCHDIVTTTTTPTTATTTPTATTTTTKTTTTTITTASTTGKLLCQQIVSPTAISTVVYSCNPHRQSTKTQ